MIWNPGGDTSVGGGKFLAKGDDGFYHFVIIGAREGGLSYDQKPLDNAAFQLECEVVGGTVDANVGKSWELTAFWPKPSDKNEGAHAKKLIDRTLLATSMATKAELENPENALDINTDLFVGRQFIAKLVTEPSFNDPNKLYIKLSFTDIYHVDDPAVKDQPKNAEYLKPSLFDPKLRWDPAAIKAASAPAKKTPATPPVPATNPGFI